MGSRLGTIGKKASLPISVDRDRLFPLECALNYIYRKYFSEEPNTASLKKRQFADLLTRMTAAASGRYAEAGECEA